MRLTLADFLDLSSEHAHEDKHAATDKQQTQAMDVTSPMYGDSVTTVKAYSNFQQLWPWRDMRVIRTLTNFTIDISLRSNDDKVNSHC